MSFWWWFGLLSWGLLTVTLVGASASGVLHCVNDGNADGYDALATLTFVVAAVASVSGMLTVYI